MVLDFLWVITEQHAIGSSKQQQSSRQVQQVAVASKSSGSSGSSSSSSSSMQAEAEVRSSRKQQQKERMNFQPSTIGVHVEDEMILPRDPGHVSRSDFACSRSCGKDEVSEEYPESLNLTATTNAAITAP